MRRTRRHTKWWGLALVLALGGAEAAVAADGPEVAFQIVGLRRAQGTVRCALFASAEGFPTKPKKAVRLATSGIKGRQAVCAFETVPPGRYAAAFFHDEDVDGELDTSMLGIPQEGVGASNDATGTFGPPSFEDAAFDVTADGFVQTVRISY